MKISLSDLRSGLNNILSKSFSKTETNDLVNYLMWAEMSGNKTQGVLKLTGSEPLQNIKPQHDIKIERETKLSQLVNAGAHPAPLVSMQATKTAIEKAKAHGFGIVGVRNTFSSNGAQAYYAKQIAENDLIGIVMARSPGAVAPFNSMDPLFGTNPIGFSFPTNNDPLVFDMATSAMTWYGLVLAKAQGKSIPSDLAIDKNGAQTVDPSEVMDGGAIHPFDKSFKGSGIGMVVEMMSGPLVGSAFCDYKNFDKEWGSVFFAIDPELLVDLGKFKQDSTDLVRIIKESRHTKDTSMIRIPGERSQKNYEESKESGEVDIEEAVLRELGII